MSVFKGDYMGFTYNGVHSSSLGIVRVSDGSRFTENLLPNFQEKTAQVPGGDGTYYFGSQYTQNKFSIQFAFDAMAEKQLQDLKVLFSDKKPHPLIFDEAPYKAYFAKVTGSNVLKYVPFGEGPTNRVYKGEGEIQFVCYQPYAVCKGERRDYNYYKAYSNIDEWNGAADLVSLEKYDKLYDQQEIWIRNPGVKESECILKFTLGDKNVFYGAIFTLQNNVLEFGGCKPKTFNKNGITKSDTVITFNSKNKLIEGWYDNNGKLEKSGNLYNEYIVTGDFFNIPITTTKENEGKTIKLQILPRANQEKSLAEQFESIDYNYYYF